MDEGGRQGTVAITAALIAGSVALLGFGIDSAIEGLASVIVIWRFTGGRRLSEPAELRAQKAVAISFFVLAHYIAQDAIGRAIVAEPGVSEVHDLHVWEITSAFPALSAHVLVGTQNNCHATRRHLEALLHDHFEIEHTTLQVEHEGSELLDIEMPEQHERAAR
jgi:divalent metal cation (Fe/Co/Zn/Cd) transporter